MGSWMDHHRKVLHRARRVSTLLLDLWGEAPPPAPDPALVAAVDALSADDGFGRAAHVIVQGDDLTYRQLDAILALVEDPDHHALALRTLPPRLRRRLEETDRLSTRLQLERTHRA